MFCKELGDLCLFRGEFPYCPGAMSDMNYRYTTMISYLAISAALKPAAATIIV